MSDLISRQDAIDAIEDDSSTGVYSCFASYSDAQKFKQIVNELPSAERRGKWIGGELGNCSECGHYGCASDIWNGCKGMYCPNCGARMVSE